MTRKVEKTFTVAVPLAQAWEAFANSHERSQWEAVEYEIDPRPGGLVRWTLPGIEATGRVEEAEPPRLLRHTELTGPHAGSEITVTFEEVTVPVFTIADLWVLMREHPADTSLDLEYVHDRERRHGRGVLTGALFSPAESGE